MFSKKVFTFFRHPSKRLLDRAERQDRVCYKTFKKLITAPIKYIRVNRAQLLCDDFCSTRFSNDPRETAWGTRVIGLTYAVYVHGICIMRSHSTIDLAKNWEYLYRPMGIVLERADAVIEPLLSFYTTLTIDQPVVPTETTGSIVHRLGTRACGKELLQIDLQTGSIVHRLDTRASGKELPQIDLQT